MKVGADTATRSRTARDRRLLRAFLDAGVTSRALVALAGHLAKAAYADDPDAARADLLRWTIDTSTEVAIDEWAVAWAASEVLVAEIERAP